MKKLSSPGVLALLIVTANLAFGQSMVPGYIVSKGDTLRGFILDRNNKWSVGSISFSTSVKETPRVYTLDEVSTMYLQSYDAVYQTRTVEIDKKPVDFAQLEKDGTRNLVVETVLLEEVLRGTINLYDYMDENSKRHFFIQKSGGKTEELAYVKYVTPDGRIVELSFYRGTLQSLTADCNLTRTPPSNLERKPLTKYIGEYNVCMGGRQVTKERNKNKLIASVFGGPSFGSGSFEGTDASNNGIRQSDSNGSYGSTTALNVGLSFELHSSRASKKWRPGVQVFYQKTGSVMRINDSPTVGGEYIMDFKMVHLGPTFTYLITNHAPVHLYAKAGFSATSILNGGGVRTYYSQAPSRVFASFKPFGYSGSVGAGLKWKIISLELRYQLAHLPCDITAAAEYKGPDVLIGIQLYK